MYQNYHQHHHMRPQSRKSSSSSTGRAAATTSTWKSSSKYQDFDARSVGSATSSEVSYEAELQRRLRKYTKPNQGLLFDDDELYQLDQRSELSYNEDQIENESSKELLRESKLTRMEAKIGLIQSNLTELRDEMRRIQQHPSPSSSSLKDDNKTTRQLQKELRIADDILKRLELEEEEERPISLTPKKSSLIKHDHDHSNVNLNNEEPTNDMESLIDQEMNILKRIYADNQEFLLVVLKEMKFITTNNSRMECLDFLSQIRKNEETEIEKLKSPKKTTIENGASSVNNKSFSSLSRTLPYSDGGSVATSVRAMISSEKDTDSIVSEDAADQSFSVTADLIGFLTTKLEGLLMRIASEKLDEGFRGYVSKGDVIHICKETWSYLQDLEIECEVETINPIFDVLELFIGKMLDNQTQEDMLTDIMDVITTYLFYYRAVSQLVNSTSVMPTKEQRAFIEPRLDKLREKKDADLDNIIRNRNQYISFKEHHLTTAPSVEPSSTAGDDESSFVDEEEDEEEEDQSESNYAPLDNLMTLEELMEKNGINDDELLEDDEEMKQLSDSEVGFGGEGGDESTPSDNEVNDNDGEEVPIEIVRNTFAHPPREDFNQPSTSPKRAAEEEQVLTVPPVVVKRLGLNVNNDKIKRMMEDEENDLEIQFLSRVSAITVPGSIESNNQYGDYSDFAATVFKQ